MKQIKILIILLLLAPLFESIAQEKIWNETKEEKEKRMAWWVNDRFGMFIHFGLYSLPARHEWVKNEERLTNESYEKYFEKFNPDLYNPKEWAQQAKAAGMKYAVITTKHHEGFTLFDSKLTDYKVTNTPYGKDLLREWVDAFRAEGLKVGFYYSVIDWHHPEYTIDRIHPLRPNNPEEYAALNKDRDMGKYRKYMHAQVKELLTNYGKVDMLWFDYTFPGEHGKTNDDWDAVKLMKMVRKLQPDAIVNDRLDLKDSKDAWDFTTPEQFKLSEWPQYKGERIPWETCQTFSGSWGYHRDEMTWKNEKQLLGLLIESVSKGGNLLLNVGPDGRGSIDYRAQEALQKMGKWTKYNGRSIYGCTQAPDEFEVPDNTLLTYNPKTNRLYIHLLDYPLQNFTIKGYKGKVKYAQFLHDASEIQFKELHGFWNWGEEGGKKKIDEGDLNLSLPVRKPPFEIPVIELILK